MLDQIKIASPCTADWDQMEGTDRVRFCQHCQKNVFNLSEMTRRDAEALLKETSGNICTRLYRRADGTVLTADCPVGLQLKVVRVRRRLGWAIAGAMSFSTGVAQTGSAVSGTIKNADGSVVANTPMMIKGNLFSVETITDEHGAFSATDVTPGRYRLTVANISAGFDVTPGSAVELVLATPATIQGAPSAMIRRKRWWRRIL
jgi:hypothetical protein